MGRKSRMKKQRREVKAMQQEMIDNAPGEMEQYLDDMVDTKEEESAHRQKEADKLMDELTELTEETEAGAGIKAALQEVRRLKDIIDQAESVSIEDLDKMKAEFPALMVKCVKRRHGELTRLVANTKASLEDRARAKEDLTELEADGFYNPGVEAATDSEKDRCDYIAAIINERTYHNAYLELHAQAKAKRGAAFMNKFKDPSGFITIDRMWATGGFVQIMDKRGVLTTLTVQEAAMRAQALSDMLPHSSPWHRDRWAHLIEQVIETCREAQSQRLDRGNRSADLLRQVYDGIDQDGNPVKITIDDRWIANSKKLYPLLTEDEIIAVFSDKDHGMTVQQKEKLCLEMFRRRAVEKGMNPDALQSMDLE